MQFSWKNSILVWCIVITVILANANVINTNLEKVESSESLLETSHDQIPREAKPSGVRNMNSTLQSSLNSSELLLEPYVRNAFSDSYFCGQIIGGHYMFGSPTTYCGGFSVRECSAQCFNRNFTFFQCNGLICHCYS